MVQSEQYYLGVVMDQDRATATSFPVSWILAKKKKSHSQTLNDHKIKIIVTSTIENIPLSDASAIHMPNLQEKLWPRV